MRDRERANRGGRADRRLVRLARRRQWRDGLKGPQRGFFLGRRGRGGRRGGGRFGLRRRQPGFLFFRCRRRRRGYFLGGSEGDRSRFRHFGRHSRRPGLHCGWRRDRQWRPLGRRRGRKPCFNSGWSRGDGRCRRRRRSCFIGRSCLQWRRGSHGGCARRRRSHGGCMRSREPSNRRGRPDGCIVLGAGGRAYRAERDKPGRQRRGYRGPHR